MYREFYGLNAEPFSLNSDASFFFPGKSYKTAEMILDYAILRKEGVVLITGEIGCGKTALIHHFLRRTPTDNDVGVISNPGVLRSIPLYGVLGAFGQLAAHREEAELYAHFQSYLKSQYDAGRSTILIVDEAQSLSQQILEELRILTNPEPHASYALQLVLVGQPQIRQTLFLPGLSQLLQRVTVHYHLYALEETETIKYVLFRLKRAQCDSAIFTPAALSRIYVSSRGIPRVINIICDISLMYGYAEGLHQVDEDVIKQVISDRDITSMPGQRQSPTLLQHDSPSWHMDHEDIKLLFKKQ